MSGSKDSTHRKDYVCVVGGINVDVFGKAQRKFIYRDSNPGKVKFSVGGVGRNLAVDLVKLGMDVEFITMFGNDNYATKLKQDCKENMINLTYSKDSEEYGSSYYLAIEDKTGEMCAAVSDMKIYDLMDSEFIEKRLDVLNLAQICVLDTNLPKETLRYIAKNVKVPIFLDAVSVNKSDKIRSILSDVHTLKLNQIEAENLSSVEILDEESLRRATSVIMKTGVKQVFITLGSKGVHYKNLMTENTLYANPIQVRNVTGAGDAFFSGAIWSYLRGEEIDKMAYYGQAAARIALKCEFAGADNLCETAILNEDPEEIIHRGKVL